MSRRQDIDLLRRAGIELTLVDVGASFEPFEPFQPLLPAATYVGFDPDRREISELKEENFHRYIIINKAVISDRDKKKAHFFLAKHPGNGAVSLLIWEAIRHTSRMGLRFDFCGVGTKGSVQFYYGFGGIVKPRYIASRSMPLFGILKVAREAMMPGRVNFFDY